MNWTVDVNSCNHTWQMYRQPSHISISYNTSCQVYLEINSVLRHWWLGPRANWKAFSMYHHLLAFPTDKKTLQHTGTLIIANCKSFPNQTWHHCCMLLTAWWTFQVSQVVPGVLCWCLFFGHCSCCWWMGWHRTWGGTIHRDPVEGGVATPTPWHTRSNKKRHGDLPKLCI